MTIEHPQKSIEASGGRKFKRSTLDKQTVSATALPKGKARAINIRKSQYPLAVETKEYY
jgi:hypothetical protein